MTPIGSIQRGVLYVLIAMLTQAISDISAAFEVNPIEQTRFWLQLTLTGLIVWRSFIDQSPSQALDNK